MQNEKEGSCYMLFVSIVGMATALLAELISRMIF